MALPSCLRLCLLPSLLAGLPFLAGWLGFLLVGACVWVLSRRCPRVGCLWLASWVALRDLRAALCVAFSFRFRFISVFVSQFHVQFGFEFSGFLFLFVVFFFFCFMLSEHDEFHFGQFLAEFQILGSMGRFSHPCGTPGCHGVERFGAHRSEIH